MVAAGSFGMGKSANKRYLICEYLYPSHIGWILISRRGSLVMFALTVEWVWQQEHLCLFASLVQCLSAPSSMFTLLYTRRKLTLANSGTHAQRVVKFRTVTGEFSSFSVFFFSLSCLRCCSWGREHFPSSCSQHYRTQTAENGGHLCGSLLQSGVKINPVFNPESLKVILPLVNTSRSEQNLKWLQVFILQSVWL